MKATRTLSGLALAALVGSGAGHGAMTFPTPRNAIDATLPAFADWGYPCDATHQGVNCSITFCDGKTSCQGACPKSAHNGDVHALTAGNGLSCYWYSIGCTVGCDECDGMTNHPGHGEQTFLYNGMTQHDLIKQNVAIDPWEPPRHANGHRVITMNPNSTIGPIKPICANPNPTHKPTICDSRLRTINVHAECGSPLDIYYYSPWRAPGRAPVFDSCGVAGGRRPGDWRHTNNYMNTSRSKSGDKGSEIPAMKSQATYKAGSQVEVGWTVSAHHGGGYAYRLAPADKPLTEEQFRKMPLDFVGNSILRWGGDKSTQLEFNVTARGWETNVGTVPAGSMWRKFPLPTLRWYREGPSFEPVCEESQACKDYARDGTGPVGVCKCSGHYRALKKGVANGGPLLPNIEIVDVLQVPALLKPGAYVLQWRWDCEETAQIWSSCADVTVV